MSDIPYSNTASYDDKAQEFFDRVSDILQAQPGVQNHLMHETLVLVCHEGLKDTNHGFGNLSSQVEAICRDKHISGADTLAIQRMRRDSNRLSPMSSDDLLYNCRALALFISYIFGKDIPASLVGKIPVNIRPTEQIPIANYKYIRAIVHTWDGKTLQVSVLNQETGEEYLTVDLNNTPEYIDLSYLFQLLQVGMQLNLLDCSVQKGVIIPRIIVVEPDFLLDISTIAGCFEDYGHHPLLYTVHRLQGRQSTKHTLLGNFAGAALDDIINREDFDIGHTFRSNFQEKALDFATTSDFDTAEFKQNAEQQVRNLQGIVEEIFAHFDKDKAILEPSFVCEQLGIQGRVDLMTTDMKLLVEQKSRKNFFIESKGRVRNRYGSIHIEKHYVQVLLYFGILRYNFRLSPRKTNVALLYSKYPLPDGLLEVEPLQKLLFEAIKYRNQVVATEFWIARNGFEKLLPLLRPDVLNTEHLRSKLYLAYQLPQLQALLSPLHRLSPLAKAYFCRMATFAIREQLVGKVGMQEGVGNGAADLWNMPLASKKDTGNIYTNLSIKRKEKSNTLYGYDTITLAIPAQADDFLPNFREGDMVYLYAYDSNQEPDVRKSILFKGVLTDIHTDELTVHLNDGQQNKDIIAGDCFAIEHTSSDVMGHAALHALYAMTTTTDKRQALLLGQRTPEADLTRRLTRSYHADYDEVVLKARQAKDYFLLVGPPGTGKTSQALQFLVREQLAENPASNILLLSYTNRAVDEICGMLQDNNIDFIRLGSEFSCNEQYRSHLLQESVASNPQLSSIRKKLVDSRIIVCTTSTLASRPGLYNLKQFDLAIIDEASQILEPNIVGILSETITAQQAGEKGRAVPAIRKFILVGDHKQLPAVVQQARQDAVVTDPLLLDIHLDSCANSLFERLIRTEKAAGREQFMGTLRKQGRMHPDIAAFPNRMFYASEQLECVPLSHQKEKKLSYHAPSEDAIDDFLKAHRVIFIPSNDCRQPDVSDKTNREEARIVHDIVRRIYRQTAQTFQPDKTIGIIVPYRNQIAMIRKELEKLDIPLLRKITIDTVERYQGSQRDVIIYSFTIQNGYQLDFLTDNTFIENNQYVIDRKLNVALTRARKQLILTGHEATLRKNSLFSALIDDIRQGGGYLKADEYKKA